MSWSYRLNMQGVENIRYVLSVHQVTVTVMLSFAKFKIFTSNGNDVCVIFCDGI